MHAGKLVEKSLHRHQSHSSGKSPAAGGGRHWLLYSTERNDDWDSVEHCPGKIIIKSYQTWRRGRIWSFAFFPHEATCWKKEKKKKTFLLGSSVNAKQRGEILTSSTDLQTCPQMCEIYGKKNVLKHNLDVLQHTFSVRFNDKDHHTVLFTTVKHTDLRQPQINGTETIKKRSHPNVLDSIYTQSSPHPPA